MPVNEVHKLSTGSTLLNLACTGDPYYGLLSGHIYYKVGDTSSGKTFLSMTCLAEAAANKAFKRHRFIFDNAENGALMDIKKFFGQRVYDRIEPPGRDGASVTVDDLYFHLDDAVSEGEPFIYILDSMDSLVPEEDKKKLKQRKAASRKTTQGDEVKGSYGTEKAKKNSQGLRLIRPYLEKSGSLLIIISQTRDNLATFSFNEKTRAGGRALSFYATLEMWSSVKKHIHKNYKGIPVEQGIISKVKVQKNRIQGLNHTVDLPILHGHGFDDIGGCINFLLAWKHWGVKGKNDGGDTNKTATVYDNPVIEAPEFEFSGRADKLIKQIQEGEQENTLRELTGTVWKAIMEHCRIERKPKYK